MRFLALTLLQKLFFLHNPRAITDILPPQKKDKSQVLEASVSNVS